MAGGACKEVQRLHDESLCQLGGGAKKGAEPALLAIARRHPRYTAHTPWDESEEAEGQLVENGPTLFDDTAPSARLVPPWPSAAPS